MLVTEWAWSVGVAFDISVLATLLHSFGVIPCACSELWWNYLARNQDQFLIRIKGLKLTGRFMN